MPEDTCSAKGCQQPAVHELRWNNPKLHTPDRRKVWLACEEHRQSLSDFLAARGFLKEVAAPLIARRAMRRPGRRTGGAKRGGRL